ncbi:MAG: methionine--tRNA ligase subunit beta, partial [Acidobacteriota bacterium]|nr:methionine--tRNA ligase subunit beta [Acidobacteriota bacterium]
LESIAREHYDRYRFSAAVQDVWRLIAQVDAYLVQEQPWKIAGDPVHRPRLREVLYSAAEALRIIAALAHPVLPDATQQIWRCLGQPGRLADLQLDSLAWGGLKAGTRITKPDAVFPRVEIEELSERIEAMENDIRNPAAAAGGPGAGAPTAAPAGTGSAATTAAAPAAGNAKITIDDFAKVELRVGVVKSAERIPNADKLLKVFVDIGDEVRQVLAGIAMAYAPEDLVGRKVVVVTNLAPRKMRGQESNGMLLAASAGADGKPVLCTFAEEIAPGSKVK